MSSWRKLMTPLYDKYLPQDSINLTNSQSRLFRNTSARSTLRVDSVNSSLSNEKLQQLQSEMNRLKSELNKYPNSSRTIKTLRSSRTPLNNTNFSIEEDSSSISSDEEITTRRTRDNPQESQKKISEHRYSEREDSYEKIQTDETPIKPARSNKKPSAKNLMKDYDRYEEQENSFANEMVSEIHDNDISIVDHIHEKKDVGISADMSPSMTYHEAKRQPVHHKYKEEMKTEKPKRKVTEKKILEEDIGEGKELKKFLVECQNEIQELKDIVLHSKKKIDALQDELENEKRKSYKLRQELQRQSTLKLPKIDESQDVSCLPEVESPVANRRGHHSTASSVRASRRNLSLEARESRQAPLFHSGTKVRESIRESQPKLPSDIFKWFKEKNKRSQYVPNNNFKSEKGIQASMPSGKESTSSSATSKMLKTTAVQCDFMLEKIADSDTEEQIEEQKKQISILSSQVLELKSSKNKMIETFQEIIDKLATTKTNSHNAKLEEVKEEFNGFYSEFESRMQELNKSRYGEPTYKRDKENSPSHANINHNNTQIYGASKSNMLKTYLSDNLVYSPSNIGTSFLDGLESRPFNPNPTTIKVESPFLMGNGLTQTVRSFVLSPKHL